MMFLSVKMLVRISELVIGYGTDIFKQSYLRQELEVEITEVGFKVS